MNASDDPARYAEQEKAEQQWIRLFNGVFTAGHQQRHCDKEHCHERNVTPKQ